MASGVDRRAPRGSGSRAQVGKVGSGGAGGRGLQRTSGGVGVGSAARMRSRRREGAGGFLRRRAGPIPGAGPGAVVTRARVRLLPPDSRAQADGSGAEVAAEAEPPEAALGGRVRPVSGVWEGRGAGGGTGGGATGPSCGRCHAPTCFPERASGPPFPGHTRWGPSPRSSLHASPSGPARPGECAPPPAPPPALLTSPLVEFSPPPTPRVSPLSQTLPTPRADCSPC